MQSTASHSDTQRCFTHLRIWHPAKLRIKALGFLTLSGFLSACSILPNTTPQLQPNPEAILSSVENGDATIITYDTDLMSRAEAEAYTNIDCEQRGLTLDVLRHPATASGPTSTVTFTCRRPFIS